jgi:hypothetical protein
LTTWAPTGDANAPPRGAQTNEDEEAPSRRSHDTSKESPATCVKNPHKDDRSMGTSSEKRNGSPQKNVSGHPSYSSRDSGNGREGRSSGGGRRDRERRGRDSDESTHDDREGQHPSTSFDRHLQDSSRSRPATSTEGTDDGDGGGAEEPGYQTDWETSFALVSTARPPSHHGSGPEASAAVQLHQDWGSSGEGSGRLRTSAEGPFRMVLDEDPGAVDSLHVEIQRLQARIMSRLKDSSQAEVQPRKL